VRHIKTVYLILKGRKVQVYSVVGFFVGLRSCLYLVRETPSLNLHKQTKEGKWQRIERMEEKRPKKETYSETRERKKKYRRNAKN
jgi:hypothetical protein